MNVIQKLKLLKHPKCLCDIDESQIEAAVKNDNEPGLEAAVDKLYSRYRLKLSGPNMFKCLGCEKRLKFDVGDKAEARVFRPLEPSSTTSPAPYPTTYPDVIDSHEMQRTMLLHSLGVPLPSLLGDFGLPTMPNRAPTMQPTMPDTLPNTLLTTQEVIDYIERARGITYERGSIRQLAARGKIIKHSTKRDSYFLFSVKLFLGETAL